MEQQKRFLLALVLSGLVLATWQIFFAPPVQTAPAETQLEIKNDAKTAQHTAATTPAPEATPQPKAEPTPQVPVEQIKLATERFAVTLSNRGGRVTGFTLLKPEQYQKAGDLLGNIPKDSEYFPFGLEFTQGNVALPDQLVYAIDQKQSVRDATGNYTTVVLRYTAPGGVWSLEKTYAIHPKHPYSLNMSVKLTNTGSATLSDQLRMNLYGYHDKSVEKSFFDFRPDPEATLCYTDESLERYPYSSLDKIRDYDKAVTWGGVSLRYFFYGFVPERDNPSACQMSQVADSFMRTQLTWTKFAINPGESYGQSGLVYMGPKDVDVLDAIGHDLIASVDYGILTVLAKPLRWLLNFFYNYVGNWGLAIILLTLVIKLLTWPFNQKSYANTERMKEIQPLLDEVRKKYENDQQRLAEETMKLFKEHKFNPLGGCLPMLVQMPILYALYVMIVNSVELYHAEFFLWYVDLSERDPYFVLPILMGVVMFIQQSMMTPPPSPTGANQQAQTMMKIMPVMFTAFMLFLPSGLVLYYFLNLLLGIFQQLMIKRSFAKKASARHAANNGGVIG